MPADYGFVRVCVYWLCNCFAAVGHLLCVVSNCNVSRFDFCMYFPPQNGMYQLNHTGEGHTVLSHQNTILFFYFLTNIICRKRPDLHNLCEKKTESDP